MHEASQRASKLGKLAAEALVAARTTDWLNANAPLQPGQCPRRLGAHPRIQSSRILRTGPLPVGHAIRMRPLQI